MPDPKDKEGEEEDGVGGWVCRLLGRCLRWLFCCIDVCWSCL